MRVALIGGVRSSYLTLEKLVEHGFDIVKVFAYEPSQGITVSGFSDLKRAAAKYGMPCEKFKKINDHTESVVGLDIDVLFVVGLSQLVAPEIISSPSLGCVGFHPTKLPDGRGRAPLAWLTYEGRDGAATFFSLENEADTGGILVQTPFSVSKVDHAYDVERKLLNAMSEALDAWLPSLYRGVWNPVPQDDAQATEYGMRKPEDGLIDWSASANEVSALIRSAAAPHPGAYTFWEEQRIIIAACRSDENCSVRGVVGRVLKIKNQELLVQCKDLALWVRIDHEVPGVKVGDKFGLQVENEVWELKREVALLRDLLRKLGTER